MGRRRGGRGGEGQGQGEGEGEEVGELGKGRGRGSEGEGARERERGEGEGEGDTQRERSLIILSPRTNRRVRAEERRRLAHAVKALKNLLLDVQRFKHGLRSPVAERGR